MDVLFGLGGQFAFWGAWDVVKQVPSATPKITSVGATVRRPLLSPMAKSFRMPRLFWGLLAASWRLPALSKIVLFSARWPRFAETPAPVYAVWALFYETIVFAFAFWPLWGGWRKMNNVWCFSRGLWSLRTGLTRGALACVLGLVWPKPPLPSRRNCELARPSRRRGGVWEKVAMFRVLGLVFEGLGPPAAVSREPQHEPL